MKTLILSTILLFCCMGTTQAQSWTRSTSTLHGGEIGLGAMVDAGSVLDFWVSCPKCNPAYPSLVAPPVDQFGNVFSPISWTCPPEGNCAHYRLKVRKSENFESVTAFTEEIGDTIHYSVVMTGNLGH